MMFRSNSGHVKLPRIYAARYLSCHVCYVGSSFCDELITRIERSYRVCVLYRKHFGT
jgi:hypothetical protein